MNPGIEGQHAEGKALVFVEFGLTDVFSRLGHQEPDDNQMGTEHDGIDPEQPPPSKLLDWVSSGDRSQRRSDDGSQGVESDGVPGLSGGDEISDGPGHITEGS